MSDDQNPRSTVAPAGTGAVAAVSKASFEPQHGRERGTEGGPDPAGMKPDDTEGKFDAASSGGPHAGSGA